MARMAPLANQDTADNRSANQKLRLRDKARESLAHVDNELVPVERLLQSTNQNVEIVDHRPTVSHCTENAFKRSTSVAASVQCPRRVGHNNVYVTSPQITEY